VQRKLGEHVECLSSGRFRKKMSETAVRKMCDPVERFGCIISVSSPNGTDTGCSFV
jgi:hypothetical protein